MAEASEYQRQKFIELYGELDTAALQGLSQADFDSIVPPQAPQVQQPVAAPPAPPEPTQKVQEPKAPAPKVEATPEPPRTSFSFEDMQVPSDFEPVGPPAPFRLPEGINLGERVRRPIGPPPEIKAIEQRVFPAPSPLGVAEEAVMERSKDPFGAPDVEKMERERARAQRILETPQTPGGARSFLTGLGEEAIRVFESPLVRALGPQQIATPTEARQLDQFEFELAQATANQLMNENTLALKNAERAGDRQAIEQLVKRREELKGNLGDDPIYLARRRQNRDIAAQGGTIGPFATQAQRTQAITEGITTEGAKEFATDLAKRAFTQRQYGGRIVESPFAYTMRTTAAPVAALAGGVEAAVTDKPAFGEEGAIPESIKGGETFMIKGADAADAAAISAGLPESYLESTAGTASRYLGGGAGLAFDFALPIFPLVGTASRATRAGIGAAKVGKGLGVPSSRIVGRAALQAAGKDIPFAGRYIFSKRPFDQTSAFLKVYAETNRDGLGKVIKTWDDATEGSLNTFAKLEKAEQVDKLKKAANEVGLSYDEFDELAKKFNLDVENINNVRDLDKSVKRYASRYALDSSVSDDVAARIAGEVAVTEDDVARDIASNIIREREAINKMATDTPPALRARRERSAALEQRINELPAPVKAKVDGIMKTAFDTPSQKTGVIDEAFVEAFEPSKATGLGAYRRLPQEVLDQVLLEIGNKELAASPRLLPNYMRIATDAFIPRSSYTKFQKELEKSGFLEIRDRFVSSLDDAGNGKLSPDDAKALYDITGPLSSKYGSVATSENFRRFMRGTPTEDLPLTSQEFNILIDQALSQLSKRVPAYKGLREVAGDVQDLQAKAAEGFEGRLGLEQYKSKVLTPKEVAGGTLENTLVAATKSLANAEPQSNPISAAFVDEIGQKWASIPEEFKMKYRQNRGLGLEPQEAWAKTILDNYKGKGEGLRPDIEKFGLELPDDPILRERLEGLRATRITRMEGETMFRDYLSMLFGGHESYVQGIQTTRRTQLYDNMVVSPAEMKKLVGVMAEHPLLYKLEQDFAKAFDEGNNIEALNILRNTHAILMGRSITDLIPNQQALKKLFDESIQRANTPSGFPFKGGVQEGTRGMVQIWDYAKESAPMYSVGNHLELLAVQYNTRRQAVIMQESYNNWAQIMPELFPSGKNIEIASAKYGDIIIKKVKDMLEVQSLRRQDIAEIGLKDIRIIDPLFEKAFKKVFPETDVDLLSIMLQGGAIPPGTPVKGTWVNSVVPSKIIEPALKELSVAVSYRFKDPVSARRLYIALIEDRLTKMGSSEQPATAYREAVKDMFDPIVKDMAQNIQRQLQDNKLAVEALAKQAGDPNYSAGYNTDMATARKLARAIVDEFFFSEEMYRFHKFAAGTDEYINAIFPQLRAENNALFYDTLKTALKSAGRSNVRVLREGVLEQTAVLPITFKDKGAIKKKLVAATDAERFTAAMEELRISAKARKLDGNPQRAELKAQNLDALITEGLEVAMKLDDKQASMRGQRLGRTLASTVGDISAFVNDGRLAGIAKGGVLGGQLLPNFRYHTTNYLTAPAIINSTLGPEFAARSVMFDKGANSVMKVLTSNKSPRTVAPMDLNNPVDGFYEVPVEVVVTTPTGKVYTNYDIADIVATSSIARSQASAELTANVVKDLVSWSRINSSKMAEPSVKGLQDAYRGDVAQFIKEAYGTNFIGNRQMNMFSEMANLTDTQFRVKVLVKALEEGRTPQEAATLAREALFDYGNLSRIEKEYINKAFWFWTFRRNAYRTVLKSFLSNPERLRNAYLANGYFAEMDRDFDFTTVDYTEYRPFLYLIDNEEMKQRYGMYGPAIPQLQSTAELIDYMSGAVALMNDARTENLGGFFSLATESTAKNVGELANPYYQTAIGLAFGVDVRREGKELGYYLDPRLMWYLQQNPERWECFSSLINIEAVEPDREIPGRGTYQGRQWQIKKGDTASVRAWFAIQQMMLFTGIQRNMRDYVPAFEAMGLGADRSGEREIPIQLGGAPRGPAIGEAPAKTAVENMLYTGGVITPITEMNLQDKVEFNKRALNEKFE